MQTQMKSFITDHHIGLVSTCRDESSHAVPVFYHYAESENAFYFLTKSESKKFYNLKQNKKASFVIFSENPPQVYTAECISELLDIDDATYSDKFIKLVELHATRDNYPTAISTMREGELVLVKLKVMDLNYKSYIQDINELKSS